MQIDLGRLGVLLNDLSGDEVGLAIAPIYEMHRVIGGLDTPTHAPVVAAWEIHFETKTGACSYRGASVAEAVERAFADQSSWR
jgi:hypothetical protein